jgi:hypothetical protein
MFSFIVYRKTVNVALGEVSFEKKICSCLCLSEEERGVQKSNTTILSDASLDMNAAE